MNQGSGGQLGQIRNLDTGQALILEIQNEPRPHEPPSELQQARDCPDRRWSALAKVDGRLGAYSTHADQGFHAKPIRISSESGDRIVRWALSTWTTKSPEWVRGK